MPRNNDRSYAIDCLKVFAMYGVVFVHSSFLMGGATIASQFSMDFFRSGVTLFLIIWAFLLEKSLSKSNDVGFVLKKKTFSYFKGFIIWSVFYFFLSADFESLTLQSFITKHFAGYGWSGQYFFLLLFQFTIVFLLIRYLCGYKRLFWLVFLLVTSLCGIIYYTPDLFPPIIISLGKRPFIWWLPSVMAGIYLAKNEHHVHWGFLLCLCLLPVESGLIRLLDLDVFVIKSPLNQVTAICFVAAALSTEKVFRRSSQHVIRWLGDNTFGVFVLNVFIINILTKPCSQLSGHFPWISDFVLMPWITTLIVYGLCLLIVVCLEKTNLKKLLM